MSPELFPSNITLLLYTAEVLCNSDIFPVFLSTTQKCRFASPYCMRPALSSAKEKSVPTPKRTRMNRQYDLRNSAKSSEALYQKMPLTYLCLNILIWDYKTKDTPRNFSHIRINFRNSRVIKTTCGVQLYR